MQKIGATLPRLLPLLLLAGIAQIPTRVAAQSFAATKFDLNPSLPVEDLSVAGLNQDGKPVQIKKKDEAKPTKERKEDRTTTIAAAATTTVAAPPTPVADNKNNNNGNNGSGNGQEQQQTIVPFSSEHSQAVIPPANLGRAPAPTAPHAQPMSSAAATASQPAGNAATSIEPQPQLLPQQHAATLSTVAPLLEAAHQQQPQPPQHQAAGSLQKPLRADEWFREDFDTIDCPRDGASVADAFRRKFPRNLLRDGKEAVLAELLATRIRECREKHDSRHWSRVDAFVAQSTDAPATEREECVAGLIEEQIACMNVISYSCQFIRPTYAFRLLPTRIIVQEARYAEDGADKCRKFTRKLPPRL